MKIINSPDDALHIYALYAISSVDPASRPLSTQAFGPAFCHILHRTGPFQTELCIFPPGLDIPHHTHPDVDAIEYQISGTLDLFINGLPMTSRVPAPLLPSLAFRIPAGTDHHVVIGPRGCSFFSIQQWHRRPLDHIGHNWSGTTYSPDQQDRLDV